MNFFKSAVALALILNTGLSFASNTPPSVVNKKSCHQLANTTAPFILVLDKGDNLIASITQCANDANLKGATVTGLGQVHNPTLAYYSADPKAAPSLTTFPGMYELISINGNITNNNGTHYTHLHVALADHQFHSLVGHLRETQVEMTVEINIQPLISPVERMVDQDTGFGPIVH